MNELFISRLYRFGGFLYIIIFSGLFNFISLPNTIKGILALPLIIIIPKKIGELILHIFKKFNEKVYIDFSFISKVVMSWIIGTYSILILILILNSIDFLSLKLFTIILLFLVSISYFLSKPKDLNIVKAKKFIKKNLSEIILLGIITLSPILIIKYFQPYPFHYSSATLFNYLFETLKFINGNELILTAGVHTPIIPILLGIPSILFNVHPISIFWAGNILTYLLFSFGIYLFSYEISNKKGIALISSLFAIFMFAPIEFKPLYAFSMRTILAVIFPYTLFIIHREFASKIHNINLSSLLKLIFSSVFLFILFFIFIVLLNMKGFFIFLLLLPLIIWILSRFIHVKYKSLFIFILIVVSLFSFTHIWMSLIVLPIILFYISINYLFNRYSPKIISYGTISFFFLYIGFQKFGIIKIPQGIFSQIVYGTVIDIPTFGFADKFNNLLTYGPEILVFLFILGTVFILFNNHSKMLIILTTAIFSLLVFFFPEPQFFRVIVFTIPFLAMVSAYAVQGTYNSLFGYKKNIIGIIYLIILFLIIFLSLFTVQINYINSRQNNAGFFASDFESYDYQASRWINDNTPRNWEVDDDNTKFIIRELSDPRYRISETREIKIPLTEDTLIISDPYSMWVLEGLSGRKQLIDQRAFINLNEYSNESVNRMQYIKHNLFLADNSKDAYELINKLKFMHDPVLIIVNPRTSVWVLNTGISNQFFYNPPSKLATTTPFKKFYDKNYFTLLYSSSQDDLYIFSLNSDNNEG